MAISFSFRQLTVVLLLVLFQCQAWAFDQHKPEGISDKNWASLKAAVEEAKLLPADGANSDYFGHSVSLSGNRALIGSYLDDENTTDSGAAYIFELQGGSWVETAKLMAGDGANNDRFGYSVSLSGDRALIGAHQDDDNGAGSGSAYVFDLSGGSWSETAKLTASDGTGNDTFGISVSLSGDRALIGAHNNDDDGPNSGSAYVFDLQGGLWLETIKLTASDGGAEDRFGNAVSLSGDRALIGAYLDNDNGSDSGAAYLFDLQGGVWSETIKLMAGDGGNGDHFGNSVSLSGDRALVGAHRDGNNKGSAYVFELQGGSWTELVKLTASDGGSNDLFGVSVSLSGDWALIGAYGDDDTGGGAGAAYVFDLYNGVWAETDKLTTSDGAAGDYFGFSVSLSGDRALIGAYGDGDNDTESGSAYVFGINLDTYTIGGQVSGLAAGNTVILQNNGGDDLSVSSDGNFTFATALYDLSSYSVTVLTQPTTPNQTCAVSGGSNNDGSGILAGADVTDITVTCSTNQYSVGGTVSGLAGGNTVVLQNNGGDDLAVNTDGGFTFNTELDDQSAYAVTVLTQPGSPNQQCTVSQGTGVIAGGDVNTVQVYCVTDVHTIGGQVSGLISGNYVTLSINSGDEYLVVNSNGAFSFLNPLTDISAYEVSVLSNPTTPNQNCTVINGSGTVQGTNVTDIEVNCSISQYFIGGYVHGLIPDNYMRLQNNLTDDLTVSHQGAFAFATPLDDQHSYDVTIHTQPNSPIQSCDLINGAGTLTGSDINDVFISCEFGDDLIFRHGFDTPEAISRALWAPDDNKQ